MAVSQTLSVTEVAGSVNNSANTSKVRILWQSTQTGDSWNGYTRVAKYYVSINGGAEQEYSVSYTLPKGSTKTIVDTTITVSHKADGAGTVKVRTWMDTSISAGVVEKSQTINLTNIPRASTLSYISNVTLGNMCTVKWIPLSREFRFKIKFSIGSWSMTTEASFPNTTTLYTNSYTIWIGAAEQFPNSKDAEMTATLYTYSDAECTKQVGEASTAKCRVYIPENEQTLPTVAMSLTPVNSLSDPFKGLYIQGKSAVKASFSGSFAKYGASISSYSMTVNRLGTYGNPYQSSMLPTSGSIAVKGVAIDSRGLSASTTQNITVIPYSKPSLIPYTGESSIVCKRCDPNGNLSPSGACLRIKVGRQYSKVLVNGVQKNFSLIRYQYKAEGGTSWSGWTTILPKDIGADSVDVTLTNISLSISTTYLVQIEVIDDIGESYSTLISIPTADVTVHLRAGGKAIGIGKYAEKDHIVDIDDEWGLNVRGVLKAGHIEQIDSYANKDFNELTHNTGYYADTSMPSYFSCKNYPVDKTGVLEVISVGVFAYQTYRTHEGDVYTRSYYSNVGWTEWKKIA